MENWKKARKQAGIAVVCRWGGPGEEVVESYFGFSVSTKPVERFIHMWKSLVKK